MRKTLMFGIHVINLHIVLKLLKKRLRHYSMTELFNLDKLKEYDDVDAYYDILTQYAKNVNAFYIQYKKEHNFIKQFSKDGKIFYHDVEV